MITEEDFVWWKETEALRARLKIAEGNLLEMQTRNRELEKAVAGLMSGMNLPLYQGRIDFVESKLHVAREALKKIKDGDYHEGGSTCLAMMSCCSGAENISDKALLDIGG